VSSSPLYAQFLYANIEPGGNKQQCLIKAYVVKDHSQHTIGVEFSSRTVKLGRKENKAAGMYSTQLVAFGCQSDLTYFGTQRDRNDSCL
jgi:hypothetical protein